MISLIQIYEMLVDLIMLWLSWRIYFFSLNKYFYILFFLFPASLWLKDHNKNKAIRLFCVILAKLVFISLILLLTSIFFYLWLIFLFFKSLVIQFLCTYLDILFFWQSETYLITYLTCNNCKNRLVLNVFLQVVVKNIMFKARSNIFNFSKKNSITRLVLSQNLKKRVWITCFAEGVLFF